MDFPVAYEICDMKSFLADDDPARCRCPSQKPRSKRPETGIDFYPVIPFGCPYQATAEDGLCDECRGEEGEHVTFQVTSPKR